jgi:hypothetical protein
MSTSLLSTPKHIYKSLSHMEKSEGRTDQWTDGQIDEPMDIVSYRSILGQIRK